MYFKDVFTELKDNMMKMVRKGNDPLLCPNCKEASLKKCTEAEHMIDVAVSKFVASSVAGSITAGATSPLGGAVPAPDYKYRCPNCKQLFVRQETPLGDRFVPLDIWLRLFPSSQGGKRRRRNR